ncbi:hypothetical protein HanPI659440_Chr03g0100711 [Helianthus annuus]|nr:hypothetical protein HanPI659440_Chr03g0100711 [Helianthus annuus]
MVFSTHLLRLRFQGKQRCSSCAVSTVVSSVFWHLQWMPARSLILVVNNSMPTKDIILIS